ncbi:MAG: thiamine diphosphokinase [Mucilaginibacter sp.]
MSSHHIVREKQEPALLILGLDSFSDELLGQLLEWSPTVIVTPSTAEKVHAFGIKIDWIITDREDLILQSDIKLMPTGNDTEADAAIKYLITHGYSAVNIITDNLQLKDYLFFIDKINMVIYYQRQKVYAVNSGFSKWKPAGETIQLISEPQQLHIGGLEPIDDNQFKTTHDGFFSLQFEQPFLFIAEEL